MNREEEEFFRGGNNDSSLEFEYLEDNHDWMDILIQGDGDDDLSISSINGNGLLLLEDHDHYSVNQVSIDEDGTICSTSGSFGCDEVAEGHSTARQFSKANSIFDEALRLANTKEEKDVNEEDYSFLNKSPSIPSFFAGEDYTSFKYVGMNIPIDHAVASSGESCKNAVKQKPHCGDYHQMMKRMKALGKRASLEELNQSFLRSSRSCEIVRFLDSQQEEDGAFLKSIERSSKSREMIRNTILHSDDNTNGDDAKKNEQQPQPVVVGPAQTTSTPSPSSSAVASTTSVHNIPNSELTKRAEALKIALMKIQYYHKSCSHKNKLPNVSTPTATGILLDNGCGGDNTSGLVAPASTSIISTNSREKQLMRKTVVTKHRREPLPKNVKTALRTRKYLLKDIRPSTYRHPYHATATIYQQEA